MNKKVFVVIVTYNGARWIDKNIPSLLQSDYPVSIIVIDNCSADDTVVLLHKYPEVDLIQSETNLGFGKANNIGIQKALEQGADYVFLLNQDAWIFNDTIASLVVKMEKHPQLGILSPQHYSTNGADYDAAFATYLSRTTHNLQRISTAVVPFVNAAAWMLSAACVKQTGFFEALFGHYGEDRNYCDRVTYHNFTIGIDLDSKVVHDRVIVRNIKKDTIQAKYKILTTLLNINHSLLLSYFFGLKEVIGLPKYFLKFYGFSKVFGLFITLLLYYLSFLFQIGKIKHARKKAMLNG